MLAELGLRYSGPVTSQPPVQTGPKLAAALTGHVGYLAIRVGQRAQHLFETAIADLDLRPPHYDFLATVVEQGPLSQRELAATLGIDAARIVTTTDLLEERGLVTRTVDPGDRRRNQIVATRSGRALAVKVGRLAGQVEGELLAELSTEERAGLRLLLRRVMGFEAGKGSGDHAER
jgi:DNA-binding MarR family transcriptional regulator